MQCRPLAGHPHLLACLVWTPDPSGEAPSTSALVGVRLSWVLVWRVLPPLPHLKRSRLCAHAESSRKAAKSRRRSESRRGSRGWHPDPRLWPSWERPPIWTTLEPTMGCIVFGKPLRYLIQKGWLCRLSGLHTHVQTQNANVLLEGLWTKRALYLSHEYQSCLCQAHIRTFFPNMSSFNLVLLPTLQRYLFFNLSNTRKESTRYNDQNAPVSPQRFSKLFDSNTQ